MKCSIAKQLKNLSQNPGVYIFKDASGQILYIGKATNLKSRVSSYFSSSRKEDRPVMAVLDKISKIETRGAESVLEALILEANLIKKNKPPYNVDLKDDKSFSYVVITKEDFPRVLITRESDLDEKNKQLKIKKSELKISASYGPYVSKKQLEIALKIIRKIFPYHSWKEKSEKGCLDFQIGLCPGPYADAISKADYKKNIRNVRMILEGKKRSLLRKLQKEMDDLSKQQEFEKAAETRNRIFALRHIRDIALISKDGADLFRKDSPDGKKLRIEAYDISNISGKQAVGSMVVFNNDEPDRKEYRRFRVKTVEGSNDIGMMAEVLFRRFRNSWMLPDLILLDGGKGHLNMAEKVLAESEIDVPLVAVAKGPTRKVSDFRFISSKIFPPVRSQEIFLKNRILVGRIIEESHRFAITYHRKIRGRELLVR